VTVTLDDPASAPEVAGATGGAARAGGGWWAERLPRVALALAAVVLVCAVWELYKLVGSPHGGRLLGVPVLPRNDDVSMPHVWSVLAQLGHQEVAVEGGQTVGLAVLKAIWFTLRVALAGLAAGVVVGVLLAVLMSRFKVVERGLMPYIIASQTVPLIALAPLVAGWSGQLKLGAVEWQSWMTVSLIAAYLAFFPISIGMLRGLQSPGENAHELMRSYAASWWQTLLRLRLPASVPFLLPALRLAGASAVIGAIVAEISTGTDGGIGRLIIAYSESATSDSTRLYDAVLGAAGTGLLVAGLVALLEIALTGRLHGTKIQNPTTRG
jgi:NitT/TauT family transport system permease protein